METNGLNEYLAHNFRTTRAPGTMETATDTVPPINDPTAVAIRRALDRRKLEAHGVVVHEHWTAGP